MTTQRTFDERELGENLPYAKTRETTEVTGTSKLTALLAQDDGTLRNWVLLIARAMTSGNETNVSAEESGELRTVPLIHDGTSLVRIRGEASRELAISLNASTGAGAIVLLRLDNNRILWTRSYEELLNLVAVELTNADAILIDGSVVLGNDATFLYEVWFKVNNIDGTNSATYTVGKDVGAGGGLASPEYWAFAEPVAGGSSTDWIYGGIVKGTDDVRGLASANGDLVIQFRVKRVDTNA